MIDNNFDSIYQINEKIEDLDRRLSELIENQSKFDGGAETESLPKIEEIYRSGIRHEDELVSKRLTWMTTIHGFLFSALGFSFGKSLSIWFYCVIGSVGIVISISTWIVLQRAEEAVDSYVNAWWNKKKSGDSEALTTETPRSIIIGSWEGDPQTWGANKSNGGCEILPIVRKCASPQNLLPISFGCAWIAIIILSFNGLDPTIRHPNSQPTSSQKVEILFNSVPSVRIYLNSNKSQKPQEPSLKPIPNPKENTKKNSSTSQKP